jgi:hypothetical protein
MSKKLWSVFVGAIIVIVVVGLQSVEHWTLVEHALEGLKAQGPTGVFLAGALMSRVLPLVLALGTIMIVIDIWRKQQETEEREEINGTTEALPSKAEAKIENSGNSSSTATGNSLVVHLPPPFPPMTHLPSPQEESFPVNVEFLPQQGQSDKMFLAITNRGHKQFFEAQCRVIAVRNTSHILRTYNLKWESDSAAHELKTGEAGNLWVASADEDRTANLEWMKLETSAPSHELLRCQWASGAQSLPEFDLDIRVLGRQSNHPQTEYFTLRAGTHHALEMYKRECQILWPSDGAEVGYKNTVSGTVGPPNAKVQLWVYAGGQWHNNGFAAVSGYKWKKECCFGNRDTPLDVTYSVIAVANGTIQGDKQSAILSSSGTCSDKITVRRTSN